jgi:hypothetical protein
MLQNKHNPIVVALHSGNISKSRGQASNGFTRQIFAVLVLPCFILFGSATGGTRSISDHKLFVQGRTFSETCAAAVGAKAQLIVGQKWSVAAASCAANLWFSKTGSLNYSGPVVLSGPVDGTLNTHFVRRWGGTLEFTHKSRPFQVSWWGAVADGSDQTSHFQDALDSLNRSGGGTLWISYSPHCYVVQLVKYYSNITIASDTKSTCVQKIGGSQLSPPPGGASVFYSDIMTPVANVHFRNFTIDGNRANITGVVGDGGNFGIVFFGASNSSVEDMIVRDAYTDGIAIDGSGPSRTILGSGLDINHSLITGSRRNNVSLLAGLNTTISNCELSYANGTSPEAGIDVEQYEAGAYVSGFKIADSEIHHNAGDGVFLNIKEQDDDALEMSVVNVNSHDNGALGLHAVNFTRFGRLVVAGGTYTNNGGCCAIALAGWTQATISGETVYGSSRGILLAAHDPSVLLGPGSISGTDYDLSVDGPGSSATLDGARLVHGIIQPGEEDRVIRTQSSPAAPRRN